MHRRLRWLPLLALAACATRTVPAPSVEPAPARSPEHAEPPTEEEPASDPLADATAIIEAASLTSRWLSASDRERLRAAGLDTELTTAALSELARRCSSIVEGNCSPYAPTAHVMIMVDLLEEQGTTAALPALIQLDARGYLASRAAEAILAREMSAAASTCEPPSAQEIAAARTSLEGFTVVDRVGSRLVPRPPTPSELDDLAYFYAGIADSAPRIGAEAPHSMSRADVDPVDAGLRRTQLERLSDSLEAGDLTEARASAVAYLASLGYPGPLDAAREADQTWGGARFSYVMRDLALVSEVVGELTTASDLYLHANPGGGMCGTSVDYRRGKQLRGFVRTQERLGRCRSVVAHRLLDWEDEYDPSDEPDEGSAMGYGPGRLARDGWDLARMYRGALLTRNRGDEAALRRALRDDEGALDRVDRLGPEHWEHRVRSAEGLADVAGREAMDELAAVLPVADDALRVRMLGAIGTAAQRGMAGPCDETMGWGMGRSYSNVWRRPVTAFGHSCATQLDDAQAEALADRMLPFVRGGSLEVRNQVMRTVGALAVPRHERMVTRWRSRAKARTRSACDGKEPSARCQDARQQLTAADDAFEAWARANGRDES